MKREFALACLCAVLVLAGAPMAQTGSASAMLRAAMDRAQVDGDLNGAIKQYQTIVDAFAKSDRAIVATALVKMAECYQKLGDAQARKIYERVVREFAEQGQAAALARARLGESVASNVMNSRLVWSGPNVDDDGTVSPDGRYVSYTNWDTGNLALRELATGADRPVTTDAPDSVNGRWRQFAEESAISKDGKQVAYSWWNATNDRYDLRLANLAGSANPRRLYDNPEIRWIMPFDWAPDGRLIAVETDRVDRSNQLGVVTVADGSLRVLKSVEWRKAGRMFFSPDGRWLGYDVPESVDGPEHHVSVLAVDGTRELLVDHHGQDQMVGWSPDGKWLLFSSDRSGATDLWAVPFADGSLGSPQLLKAGFEGAKPLGVTTSGTLYYAQAKGGGRSRIQTATIDVASGTLASPPVELPQSYQDSYRDPAWSPDGKRLAFVSERGPLSAKTYVLIVHSTENGQTRELAPKLRYLALSSWAPDGHALLVSGRDFKGRSGVYLVDVATGDAKAIGPDEMFEGNVYHRVVWAPDGRSFLLERSAGLYRIDAATGVEDMLVAMSPTQGNWGFYPNWAPDGKAVYYQKVFKAKDGAIEDCAIVERDLATRTEREVIRKSGAVCIAHPTPDGQYLVNIGTDPATNSRVVLLIPVRRGAPRELLRVPAGVKSDALNNLNLGHWPFVAGVTADGRSALVVKRRGDRRGSLISGNEPSELWLVPLVNGEPKKITNAPGAGLVTMVASRDGAHVAFTVADAGSRPTTELWALENFLPASSGKKAAER